MLREDEEIQEEVNDLHMDMELTREQLSEKFGGPGAIGQAGSEMNLPGESDEGSVIA